MKVLFIHPASGQLEFASKKYISTDAYLPPLGILYLAKMLELNGHEVEVIDCNAEGVQNEKIKRAVQSCDAVGMTLYSETIEQRNSVFLSNLVKNDDADIPLILGGAHCSLQPEQSLIDHHADVSVPGLGELTITPLIEALEGKKRLSSIPGIYYREGETIHHTKPAPVLKDLDVLPFPARHLVDKYEYGFMHGKKVAIGRLTTLTTSRGCNFRCRFCNLHAHIPYCKLRSVENITAEIKEIVKEGYDTLVFVDDNFMIQRKRVEEIMDFIIQNEINLRLWIWGARADTTERHLFEKMRNAGVEVINFGIESGSQKVLDYYKKKLTLAEIQSAVKLSKEMGFFVTATFIIGAPIETKEDIEQTIKFSKSLPIDSAVFYLFNYTYKSPLWEEAVQQGKINSDEFRVVPDSQRGLGNFTLEELMNFTLKANKSFFMSPHRWMRTMYDAFAKRNFRFLGMGIRMFTNQ